MGPQNFTSMDDNAFENLSLEAKADFVKKNASFVEAEDYYSYRILHYALEKHYVELLYDFSNKLLNVEFVEKKPPENYISSQLESFLGDTAPL